MKRGDNCSAPVLDAEKRATMCPAPAVAERMVLGTMLTFCKTHIEEIEAKEQAEVRARWDEEQAKLPLGERRTWEQACADEEARMKLKPRRSRRKGGRS